jgi:hypothetical protein
MRIVAKQYAVDGPIISHLIIGTLRVKARKVTVESNYILIRILLIYLLSVFQQYVNVLPLIFLMPLTTSKADLILHVCLMVGEMLCTIYNFIDKII